MREVVIQTSEPYYTIEATEIVVIILDSTYAKANLDQVAAAAVQIDKYQHKKIVIILT